MTGAASTVDGAVGWATVVARAVDGDEAAFSAIVRAHHADMARVAFVVSCDVEVAEDAVQAAWSVAWRKLRTLRDPERLRPWLVAVAANEARQLLRRTNRHRIAEIELDTLPAGTDDDDPEASIDRLDLVAALRHLRPEDRVLLALRYTAGLDSTEIGPVVGKSASGVRGELSRLNARLRRELRDA
ncbi:MAG TPA: sigma-70 family RNA polymerase sigma factor [Candidatus Limnocylindrales bacterium]